MKEFFAVSTVFGFACGCVSSSYAENLEWICSWMLKLIGLCQRTRRYQPPLMFGGLPNKDRGSALDPTPSRRLQSLIAPKLKPCYSIRLKTTMFWLCKDLWSTTWFDCSLTFPFHRHKKNLLKWLLILFPFRRRSLDFNCGYHHLGPLKNSHYQTRTRLLLSCLH